MRRVISTLIAVLLMLLTAIPAASAAPDTLCSAYPEFENPDTGFSGNAIFDETIDGNVIVEAGVSCLVFGSTVTGSVTGEADAGWTVVQESHVGGQFRLGENVEGVLVDSSVGGSVLCEDCLFVDSFFSSIEGNVLIDGEDEGSFIFGSTVGGKIVRENSSSTAFFFLVLGSTVGGKVEYVGNDGPVAIFDSQIGGKVIIEDNSSLGDLDGTFIEGNNIGGKVSVNGNSGGAVTIAGNTIGGTLVCADNDPAPLGGGNVVVKKTGQCADL